MSCRNPGGDVNLSNCFSVCYKRTDSQVEETFGAKPLTSLTSHVLHLYRECLEACMEEADLEEYLSRGMGMASGRDSKVMEPSKCLNGGGIRRKIKHPVLFVDRRLHRREKGSSSLSVHLLA